MNRFLPVILCLLVGCSEGLVDRDPDRKNPVNPGTTDEIDEFRGDAEVVDQEVEITNPITGPLEAVEPTRQRIAILEITHAVNLFHALEGRYPKDHDEFMEKVIKANNIRLPQLGTRYSYQYDVENHELLVVKAPPGEKGDN